LWITVPRLILAGIAVWLKRFLDWAYGTGERSRLSLW
jgi:hypothetical protein